MRRRHEGRTRVDSRCVCPAEPTARAAAREAGVDPALVLYYFGSKEALFLETMASTLKNELVFNEPVEHLGEYFIRHLLNSDDEHRSILLALVRASDADEELAAIDHEKIVVRYGVLLQ
ncbi:TetR family transcriptional regulator [Streptomyces sp. NPDC051554]|uniref:TetR family transcriptional regulator n=1 Tax=Streptomyces sp. NPDC051554 TaxID=3365656 RepID=UPI0037ABB7C9